MKSKATFQIISWIILLAILGYWVLVGLDFFLLEIGNEFQNHLGSISLYLLSWLTVFGVATIVAWLNFKFIFLRWRISKISNPLFFGIELGVLIVVFEFLQWTVQHEPTLIEDNLTVTLFIGLYFLFFAWIADLNYAKKRQRQLMQEKNHAELKLLQSQLNPHFLFNALNTTYSTAISEESTKTASQILQLAEMMRFALEKSKVDFIPIEDEIGFLEKYIQIQLDRFAVSDQEWVRSSVNWDGVDVQISPMLIQPFLENAFKFTQFGIELLEPRLEIDLKVEEGVLNFQVKNSFQQNHLIANKGTGSGIELVCQRLESIYPTRHLLKIETCANLYCVLLTLNLNE